jgi:S-phase kinase-associated protein 1
MSTEPNEAKMHIPSDSAAETKTAEPAAPLEVEDFGSGPLRLISSDNKEFRIPERKHAAISKLVAQAMSGDPDVAEMPIPNVKSATLALIVEYLTHHAGVEQPIIEKPLRSKHMKDVCKDEWDARFIDNLGNKPRQELYDLILAANYMDIKPLLHLGCAKVASLIKGQSLEKIKDILAVNPQGTQPAPAAATQDAKTDS